MDLPCSQSNGNENKQYFTISVTTKHDMKMSMISIGGKATGTAYILLCLWPVVLLEGNANFQIDLGENQDVIFFPCREPLGSGQRCLKRLKTFRTIRTFQFSHIFFGMVGAQDGRKPYSQITTRGTASLSDCDGEENSSSVPFIVILLSFRVFLL